MVVESAFTVATALIASAVIRPSSARTLTIRDVIWANARWPDCFSAWAVETSSPARYTSPASTCWTLFERTLPPVPRHGHGWYAALPRRVPIAPDLTLPRLPQASPKKRPKSGVSAVPVAVAPVSYAARVAAGNAVASSVISTAAASKRTKRTDFISATPLSVGGPSGRSPDDRRGSEARQWG